MILSIIRHIKKNSSKKMIDTMRVLFSLFCLSSRLIAKSEEVAKFEGITIPRTVEEYTKRLVKNLPVTSKDDIQDYLLDDDDEQSEENQSNDDYSQSSRMKLINNSDMKIAIKSTTKYENNNNSGGDSNHGFGWDDTTVFIAYPLRRNGMKS